MLNIMTPGPTKVRENVRVARSAVTTNPDLDGHFYDFYRDTCLEIASLMGTTSSAYILDGEGILGLEAACASLTEQGDRVLVIDNGIFGKGFQDFVTIYGGVPVLYTCDDREAVDVDKLAAFLAQDHQFKYATVVHCDTPSGVLNDISRICPLLHQYGILSVVDSVSALFGEDVQMDAWQIDILCGGSQKVVSAPPGLSLVAVSAGAEQAMAQRKTPIASFYANLQIFQGYYEAKWFPYTQPISDIYGLRVALDNIAGDPTILARHARIAKATRMAVQAAGLTTYIRSGYSNTVTVFEVPEGIASDDILQGMVQDHQIMIAGAMGVLQDKVIRLGHMGENANVADMTATLTALTAVLRKLGYPLACEMQDVFLAQMAIES